VVFVIATHEAVAEVAAAAKGLASGIFETANHLIGGAVAVAVYASVTKRAAGTQTPRPWPRAIGPRSLPQPSWPRWAS
jgi:hypothetical protein